MFGVTVTCIIDRLYTCMCACAHEGRGGARNGSRDTIIINWLLQVDRGLNLYLLS